MVPFVKNRVLLEVMVLVNVVFVVPICTVVVPPLPKNIVAFVVMVPGIVVLVIPMVLVMVLLVLRVVV